MELVQYIRDKNGQRIGAMVATSEGIGWSALNPSDHFCKDLALRIARGRVSGTVTEPPISVMNVLPVFADRATRYYRRGFSVGDSVHTVYEER